jgi:hypothetical protein
VGGHGGGESEVTAVCRLQAERASQLEAGPGAQSGRQSKQAEAGVGAYLYSSIHQRALDSRNRSVSQLPAGGRGANTQKAGPGSEQGADWADQQSSCTLHSTARQPVGQPSPPQ